ncbi:hypothetical protein TELCIR_03075 [Teladorsagia circumcincta]|uniref:Right handed beta helix domain-containing protein n=1 Tax=Teladorsagia circumcincta TaxID=45464 RepID=A0A2G9UXE4_TELCI|nr:hypothetical protein TELCIR_03075 [Teladorsagia circumcincta]
MTPSRNSVSSTATLLETDDFKCYFGIDGVPFAPWLPRFYKWHLRNNDTYAFVLPRPDCHPGANTLWDCPGLADPNAIRLSENLCQGEDDLGLICWGPPVFQGWARHWKGVQIYNSPYTYVSADPDQVAVQKESLSRLEYIDILYAGYDGSTKNTTSALWIEGVAPLMNGLRIERSARDGLYIYEPSGPVLIANSTFSWNRGHGIMVDNTTDGRVFINSTRVENNFGDGIWYRQKTGSNLLTHGIRTQRDVGVFAEEKPRADICRQHSLPSQYFFPHLLMARLDNGTLYDPSLPPSCWIENWGDGVNISYAGGAITINGTRLERNRWRGAAFHFNDSSPFLALHQEIVFKGRPSNNIFYLPTIVADNKWGGVLVGNFCLPAYRNIEPKVKYEFKTSATLKVTPTTQLWKFTPAKASGQHEQLLTSLEIGSRVTISKNAFKFNRGKYIISIGLNEDAPAQQLIFNQQNEVRENVVFNPFPELRPRSTPYAAMVVSSRSNLESHVCRLAHLLRFSNVIIRRNCFKNPQAAYEIGTELDEHAKRIDARENNWGSPSPSQFMNKIFDQFNRYSLAEIDVDPYAAVCNQRNPHMSDLEEFFREFRKDSQPFVLGGTIYENHDLVPGRRVAFHCISLI